MESFLSICSKEGYSCFILREGDGLVFFIIFFCFVLHRSFIKFHQKKALDSKGIHADIFDTLGDGQLNLRETVEDDPVGGLPTTAREKH